MTTNIFIDNVLSQSSCLYKGTYSSDSIPDALIAVETFAIVVNLSAKYEPGTHFVAIIKKNANSCFYLDPLGLPCFIPRILEFMAKLKVKNIYENDVQIQSDSSQLCAYFVMFFILRFERMDNFEVKFDFVYLHRNDRRVVKYITKMLKNHHHHHHHC